MGHFVKKTASGKELEVHRFDTKEAAEHYLTVGRRFVFDRHEPWAFSWGVDFYGAKEGKGRAGLMPKSIDNWHGWEVSFWT